MIMLKTKNNSGFVLLALIVAITLLLILYSVNISMLYKPQLSWPEEQGDFPWDEEDRIVAPENIASIPPNLPEQPKLTQSLTFVTDVIRNENKRGRLEMTFYPSGIVEGSWHAKYSHDDTRYTIKANFYGNVDPTKIYEDEDVKDTTKLFFITKGKHTQQTKTDVRTATDTGLIYVTGWLEKNLSVKGRITTTNESKSWHAIYDFTNEP